MHTNINTSYGRGLPLLPSPGYTDQGTRPTPEEHIYATPTAYGLQNRAETTSFAQNASVIPRLGTLEKKKNYRTGLEHDDPVPVAVEIPQPDKKGEEFYDKVYDDGAACKEVEEIYDPIKLDLGPESIQIPEDRWSSSNTGNSFNDSFDSSSGESESTGWSKMEGDSRELEGPVAEAGPANDVAKNPLYDTPRPQTDFI